MLSLILGSHGTKCPVELFKLLKSGCFRQKIFLTDQMRKRWVMPLQKGNNSINYLDIMLFESNYTLGIFTEICLRFMNLPEQVSEAGS